MIYSGYADRIHELMGISRELAVRDASSQQADGSRNYVSEAKYIEFDGVKVAEILTFHLFDYFLPFQDLKHI